MNDNNKLKFHITITNIETGETLHDSDACAIMAAVNDGTGTRGMTLTECDAFDLAEVLASAERSLRDVYDKEPELRPLVQFISEQRQKPENN